MAEIRVLPAEPDDAHWFDVLTGHDVPETYSETTKEAQSLRQAILADAAKPSAAKEDHEVLNTLFGRLRSVALSTPPLEQQTLYKIKAACEAVAHDLTGRVAALAVKSSAGTLTYDEQAEYAYIVRLNDVLSLLKLQTTESRVPRVAS